tara:strand:+ start:345 stop:932 length:588 start_codon:yes stop_codon:yes gene_type:complete
MAKSKKPSAKKGSRVTPRKDARRSNREYMKDTFRLYDTANEWMERFAAGYNEIKERTDVPEEVKAKMKEFIDNNQNPFGELVQSQDELALGVEKCLDNIELKWNDIEVEVVAGQLAMHTALDAGTARLTEIMSEAAEIAVEIPDEVPKQESISADELSGMSVREVAEKLGVADRPAQESESNEKVNSVAPQVVAS